MFDPTLVTDYEGWKMPHEKAQAAAAHLNADDEEWTYRVVELLDGSAVVEVIDEDGYTIGRI